tara:strand:+ start:601 stop:717 length:117 start_codon:yes stop_codon:yes gene_type:complete
LELNIYEHAITARCSTEECPFCESAGEASNTGKTPFLV